MEMLETYLSVVVEDGLIGWHLFLVELNGAVVGLGVLMP